LEEPVQRIERIEWLLEKAIRYTTLYPDERIRVDVIINPCAGSLSSEARCDSVIERLEHFTDGLVGEPRGNETLSVAFHQTHYVGHAREISRALKRLPSDDRHIVVSVGGDGTHGEVLSGYRGQERTRYVRLPFGTGNDGAETRDPGKAIGILLGNAVESVDGSIEVQPVGMSRILGFNIASIGLDAYVAYLTNRLKGKLGGDLYKVIADVMTLFYERIVGAGPMQVTLTTADGSTSQYDGRFLICAVGASGHREYGGGKLVLPADENVCLIDRCGLLGKIRLKSLFYRGEHTSESNVSMGIARDVEVYYQGRIPLQVDGETVWLRAENFPLRFSVGEPTLPVLKPRRP
jgi:diacylglycerol kinase family enzyme